MRNGMKPVLGILETKFFSWVQLYSKEIVCLGDIQNILKITPKQERELFSRLVRKGFIVRLTRGVYLVPSILPPGGQWMPDEYTIIFQLMRHVDADYQICGPLSFQRLGLSEQVPNVIAIYNTKLSGLKKIGRLSLQLIKVNGSRIGGRDIIKLSDEKFVYISNFGRTLMDSVYEWSRFNTLPIAYKWISTYINNENILSQLIQATLKYSNVATKKRIGFILEKNCVSGLHLKKILGKIPHAKGWVVLDPNRPSKGKIIKKWGIIDNSV